MIHGLTVSPTGDVTEVTITGIKSMQAAVGGYVEALDIPFGTAYFDEDGLMKRLPYNALASLICGRDLVGPVLFLGPVLKGKDTSLDVAAVSAIQAIGPNLVDD